MMHMVMRHGGCWLGLLVFFACSTVPKFLPNTGEVSQSWAGIWQGKVLIENERIPPKNVELNIVFTSTHIKAFYTDSSSHIIQYPVENLAFRGDEIEFALSFETQRGLRQRARFTGHRRGNSLMVNFEGSEGGRSFRGKWQARQVEPVVRENVPGEEKTAARSSSS